MIGPLSYIGGKNRLAAHIISLIPPHKTYVEPFAGGAQVFFHKQPSEVEVLNDLDGEIVNFFRICQNHYQELLRYMHYLMVSRKWFELLQKASPEYLTDIQRAARFFYLQKNAFAGRVFRRNYAAHVVQPPRFKPAAMEELIQAAHERLAGVQIESLSYKDILLRFDRPTTFFYLDPPYYEKRLYTHNFEPHDFEELAEVLKGLKGKFLLSLNDVPEVRRTYRAFQFDQIQLAYSAQKNAGNRYAELIIKNF
jgi:DNA adenine methylase